MNDQDIMITLVHEEQDRLRGMAARYASAGDAEGMNTLDEKVSLYEELLDNDLITVAYDLATGEIVTDEARASLK